LQAVTLILCIAFILCSAFARLHSKLFRRYRLSMLEERMSSYVLGFRDIDKTKIAVVGGKGANLGESPRLKQYTFQMAFVFRSL
jgi:hypothetical protein